MDLERQLEAKGKVLTKFRLHRQARFGSRNDYVDEPRHRHSSFFPLDTCDTRQSLDKLKKHVRVGL